MGKRGCGGMKNPCYNCVPPKREVGCHSRCKERHDYIKFLKEKNQAIKKSKMTEAYFLDRESKSYDDGIKYKARMSRR